MVRSLVCDYWATFQGNELIDVTKPSSSSLTRKCRTRAANVSRSTQLAQLSTAC